MSALKNCVYVLLIFLVVFLSGCNNVRYLNDRAAYGLVERYDPETGPYQVFVVLDNREMVAYRVVSRLETETIMTMTLELSPEQAELYGSPYVIIAGARESSSEPWQYSVDCGPEIIFGTGD